jgi:phospholipase D1/2
MKETARCVHQIIAPDGSALGAVATENIWNGGKNNQGFAFPTGNNDVVALTSGKKYFAELVKCIAAAKEEIYIVGWQVNWDAVVAPGNVRLFDVLLSAVQKNNVKIYVMPWDDLPPVQTYDDQAKSALELINKITKTKNVEVQLAQAHPDDGDSFYSHHQKQVIIDRKIAFIGGMDLAYGRFDDDHYYLKANTESRYGLNRYNGCVEAVGVADENLLVNPDDLKGLRDSYFYNPFDKKSKTTAEITAEKIQAKSWQNHYEPQGAGSLAGSNAGPSFEVNTATTRMLDADSQPRMPWQDVHCKIEGPAVVDLTLNFVMRWHITSSKTKLPLPELLECPIENKCLVQVLRSAPLAMRNLEYAKLDTKTKEKIAKPSKCQSDIFEAMLTIIDKAQHYIYIENQFFVSEFGQLAGYTGASPDADPASGPGKVVMGKGGAGRAATRGARGTGDARALPTNGIVAALAMKFRNIIWRSQKQQTPFHVYITLPVHSEGQLNDGAIMGQVHWTMQSLVFGTKSLLNCIRRAIYAKEAHEKNKDVALMTAYEDSKGYLTIPMDKCFDYVTLLNLRNWDKVGTGKDERYITEQIYVHSKLMIVDDRYAILGSANINDRSLLGSRDSEIAVLVMDTDSQLRDLKQNGKQVPVRKFARDLRKEIWRKIFGITAGGDKAATELKDAVLHPAAPASWKAIQKRAAENTALYEAAFDWIPRNKTEINVDGRTEEIPASIWPRWMIDTEQAKSNHLPPVMRPMPFDATFWREPQHSPQGVAGLSNIKGFITLLPVKWTSGENNKIPYHNQLLTRVDKTPSILEPTTQTAINDTPKNTESIA